MASQGVPTLTAQLREAAAAFPSNRAVAVPGEIELTHAQLAALVDDAAACLADAGVRSGDVVALSFPDNSIELLIMVLAVIQARAVAAPLNPILTQEQLEFYLADSRARLLITDATGNAAVQAAAANLGLDHATAARLLDAAGPVHIAGLPRGNSGISTTNEPSDMAFLNMSGLTTRRPKGVMLTQADLAASVQNIISLNDLVETDATVLVLPLVYVRFLLDVVLSSLASGASVTLPAGRNFSPSTFLGDMLASGATWYAAGPMLHMLLLDHLESTEAQYPALRFIRSYLDGFASLPLWVRWKLEEAFGAPVLEDCATTEILVGGGARVAPCIVVGTGPMGLAAAACLREQGVPFVVLERDDCIAPLWHKRHNYNGLNLRLPKKWFCELPGMPFPDDFPEYPTGRQYLDYVEGYAAKFEIRPEFNRTVLSARYDETSGLWRVRVRAADTGVGETMEYICRSLVVATGEHAERIIPDIPGLGSFAGEVTHVGDYISGEDYRGKRVLVIGSGNSGKEVALDLYDHGARPAVVAWDAAHVLPRKVFGKPTLEVASMLFERWLPVRIADKVMAFIARAVFGDLAKLGLARIRAGDIVPDVARFCGGRAEFVDGRVLDIDAVVLATGYRCNLPQAEWPRGDENGYPATAFPDKWHGRCGLYAVGFTPRGSGAASMDAARIAEDITGAWSSWREGTEPAAASQSDRKGVHVLF